MISTASQVTMQPPAIDGSPIETTTGLMHSQELETGINLIYPNLKGMERQMKDLVYQFDILRKDLESRVTWANYEELKQLLGSKADQSNLEQCSLQCEIVCSKLEQKADTVRVRALEEQQQVLSSTMVNKTAIVALQRQVQFLEERLDKEAAETHGLVSKLQAACTVQKDRAEAVEQSCGQLAEEVSRAKVQAAHSAELTAKVDGISDLSKQIISSLQLKADTVNVESCCLQLAEQGASLAKKADQADHDRLSFQVNGLQEGVLGTIRQNIEKALQGERKIVSDALAEYRAEAQTHMALLHETMDKRLPSQPLRWALDDVEALVDKRLEDFRSAVRSGWYESSGSAWLSKVERTEVALDYLQRKFTDMVEVDIKKQLDTVATQLANKAEQNMFDSLQQQVQKMSLEKADVMHVDAVESARKAEVSRVDAFESAFKAEIVRLDALEKAHSEQVTCVDSLASAQKVEVTRVNTLEFSLEAEVSRLDSLESAHKVEVTRVNTLECSLEAEVSRLDLLQSAHNVEVTRVNALEDANKALDTRTNALEDADRALDARTSTLEELVEICCDASRRPASPRCVRVGGGYRYEDGREVHEVQFPPRPASGTSPRSSSAWRRQEALRNARWRYP